MRDTAEHRGWEIEDNYQRHWADYPNYGFADSVKPGGRGFVVSVGCFLVLLMGYLFAEWYWAPPVVIFKTPPRVIYQTVEMPAKIVSGAALMNQLVGVGWQRVECTVFDTKGKTIEPNYRNPICQQRFREAMRVGR